jgi:bacteriorhodopsin
MGISTSICISISNSICAWVATLTDTGIQRYFYFVIGSGTQSVTQNSVGEKWC